MKKVTKVWGGRSHRGQRSSTRAAEGSLSHYWVGDEAKRNANSLPCWQSHAGTLITRALQMIVPAKIWHPETCNSYADIPPNLVGLTLYVTTCMCVCVCKGVHEHVGVHKHVEAGGFC